jgi:hypothetical protein
MFLGLYASLCSCSTVLFSEPAEQFSWDLTWKSAILYLFFVIFLDYLCLLRIQPELCGGCPVNFKLTQKLLSRWFEWKGNLWNVTLFHRTSVSLSFVFESADHSSFTGALVFLNLGSYLSLEYFLGPTQLHIQWVPGALSLGIKWPGCEADHSLPSSAEVKNGSKYTSTPQYVFMAWRLGKHRDSSNFTFTLPLYRITK